MRVLFQPMKICAWNYCDCIVLTPHLPLNRAKFYQIYYGEEKLEMFQEVQECLCVLEWQRMHSQNNTTKLVTNTVISVK